MVRTSDLRHNGRRAAMSCDGEGNRKSGVTEFSG